jgi:hypothetical protein
VRAIRRFIVRPVLPEVLKPLGDLARNLRWCWHVETQDLFRSVDPQLWERTGGDPVRMLADVSVERLQALVVGERGRLARGPGHDEPVGAVLDEVCGQRAKRLDVDRPVRLEGRADRGQDLSEHVKGFYETDGQCPSRWRFAFCDTRERRLEQGVETDLSKRLIDFASGLCYGLGGQMERVANHVYLLTPSDVEVSLEEDAGFVPVTLTAPFAQSELGRTEVVGVEQWAEIRRRVNVPNLFRRALAEASGPTSILATSGWLW